MAKNRQEQEAQNTKDEKKLPTLVHKHQLNTIITNKDGSPDTLAIDVYFELRSWYNPKFAYEKDGNVYHINKLKTPGIYLNYKDLAKKYGYSKETIRKKIAKLEKLGLIQRSFQHKKTNGTKSYNGLIVFVLKDTPHFYNHIGIDRDLIPELIPQTNHNYIKQTYGISYPSKFLDNNRVLAGGGIHTREDTNILNNVISKDIRSNVHTHESNFSQNTEEVSAPVKTIRLNRRKPNERKKPTNTDRKAKVVHFNQYKTPKNLKDHYPLNQEDCGTLQHKSGRPFALNAMNEILLDMSNRKGNTFCSKAQFLVYFGKCLKYEKRDAVKISNDKFHIKANYPHLYGNTQTVTQKAQQESPPIVLPDGIFGEICTKFVKVTNINVYRNWISRLSPKINEEAKMIELHTPCTLTHREIETNYLNTMQNIAKSLNMEVILCRN